MEYEIKPVNKISIGTGELWEFRELFYFFSWRDIKVKYKQTALGVLWAVLQPFLLMVVFTLFFGKGLNIGTGSSTPYPVFVISGLMLWTIFSSGITNAANSMVTNANIIKKIYFPRLIIPLSSILVSLFDFFMASIIYVLVLAWYGILPDWRMLLFLPGSILLTVLTTFGIGAWLAALNVKYRDFRYVIPFLIQVLFFLTPVIYPVSIVKIEWAQSLLALNPMAAALELIRAPLAHQPIDLSLVAGGTVIAMACFIGGLYYFRKTEYYFADLA